MPSTILRNRLRTPLLALAVLVLTLLPFAPARAASGVFQEVWWQNRKLAGSYGSISFDSNSAFSFSFALCWESSSIPPYVQVYVNGVLYSSQIYDGPAVAEPRCARTAVLRTGAFEVGGTVLNVSLLLRGAAYDGRIMTVREQWTTYDNPLN